MKLLKSIFSIAVITVLILMIGINSINAQIKKATETAPKPKTSSLQPVVIPGVKIGNQEWMVMNLSVSRFRNGDIVPEAKTPDEWIKAGKDKKPAWCYYENSAENGKKYGKLYNWYAATDKRGIAPQGWHVPSSGEWSAIVKTLGRIDMAGRRLKDTVDWKVKDRADNKSGFSALPGGIRAKDGKFSGLGNIAQYWSTSAQIGGGPGVYTLKLLGTTVEAAFTQLEKENGLSIRCLKDL
jgi:uncharacterized protein (TIGR02145 family)